MRDNTPRLLTREAFKTVLWNVWEKTRDPDTKAEFRLLDAAHDEALMIVDPLERDIKVAVEALDRIQGDERHRDLCTLGGVVFCPACLAHETLGRIRDKP